MKNPILRFLLVVCISIMGFKTNAQITIDSKIHTVEKGSSPDLRVVTDDLNKSVYLNYDLSGKAKRKARRKSKRKGKGEKGDFIHMMKVDENMDIVWEKDIIMLKKSMKSDLVTNGEVVVGVAYKKRRRKYTFDMQVFDVETGERIYRHNKKVRTGQYFLKPEIELIGDHVYFNGFKYPRIIHFYAWFCKTILVLPAIYHFQGVPFYNQYPSRHSFNIRTGTIKNVLGKKPYKSAYGSRLVGSELSPDSTHIYTVFNRRHKRKRCDNLLVVNDLLGNAEQEYDIPLEIEGEVNSASIAVNPKNGDQLMFGTFLRKKRVSKFYNYSKDEMQDNVTGMFLQHWDKNMNVMMKSTYLLTDFPDLYKEALRTIIGYSYQDRWWFKIFYKNNIARYEAKLDQIAARYMKKERLPASILPHKVKVTKDGYLIQAELNLSIYETYTDSEGNSHSVFVGYKPLMGMAAEIDINGTILWSRNVPLTYRYYQDKREEKASGGKKKKSKRTDKKKYIYTGLSLRPTEAMQVKQADNGNFIATFSDAIDVHVEEWDQNGEVVLEHGRVAMHKIQSKNSSLNSSGLYAWYGDNFVSFSYEQGKKKKNKRKKSKKGKGKTRQYKFTKVSFEDLTKNQASE